jgi:hypothetical protein
MGKHLVTVEEYEQLLLDQRYACAICKTPADQFQRALHVDHDHVTGKVRGLLCVRCNTGLGCFKDSTENLVEALHYLCDHNEKAHG